MTVFLFPGQGSQRKGIGNTLFDEFKEVTARADEILGYSIKELCLVLSLNVCPPSELKSRSLSNNSGQKSDLNCCLNP